MEYWNCISLLVKGGHAIIDADDYAILSKYHWWIGVTGYVEKSKTPDDRIPTMHAFLMKTPKGMFTDHRNGYRADNRRGNLRVVTRTENAINRGKNLHSLSKYKGVTLDKRDNKWIARITLKSRTYHIGRFFTQEDAAKAYNEVAPLYHKEFVRLNELSSN